MLLEECAKGGVEIRCGEEIARVEQGDGFTVTTQTGTYRASSLVIATGGPSIPKMGATGFAYDLARQFGLKLVEPRPALVPLTLGGEEVLFRDISGVSAPVVVSANKANFAEAALFTHRGLSGPAILQASSYWRPGEPLFVDFLPQRGAGWLLDAKRANPRAGLRAQLRDAFPARLADILTDKLALEGELGNLPDKALRAAGECAPVARYGNAMGVVVAIITCFKFMPQVVSSMENKGSGSLSYVTYGVDCCAGVVALLQKLFVTKERVSTWVPPVSYTHLTLPTKRIV